MATAILVTVPAVPQESVQTPVATVTQLMRALVIPASNALFNLPRQVPDSDDGWAEVENHAVILAESGNLLMVSGRAVASDVWASTSMGLVRAGEAALEAAQARDVEAVADIGNQIIDACERCHEKHWIR